jgi:hypothetical protein
MQKSEKGWCNYCADIGINILREHPEAKENAALPVVESGTVGSYKVVGKAFPL